uniref:Myb/SANT-like domain-containing protein n=1 Tax=Setaria italica TaxID=4555 RepID=K3YJR4_SETIT
MVKEFHLRNKFISYTKAQIQDKEDQLKRDYKMLKAARMQSGSKCNEKRNMVEGPPAMWDNLIVEIHEVRDEDDEEKEARDEEKEAREKESDAAAVETSGQRRTAAPRKKSEKEEQRPRKSTKIEGTMERYLEMRAKQAEDEAAQLAREKKVAKGDEFSIKRCISIVNAMEVIKQERAKAYAVFTKSKENKRHSYVPMK